MTTTTTKKRLTAFQLRLIALLKDGVEIGTNYNNVAAIFADDGSHRTIPHRTITTLALRGYIKPVMALRSGRHYDIVWVDRDDPRPSTNAQFPHDMN